MLDDTVACFGDDVKWEAGTSKEPYEITLEAAVDNMGA
eukprot:COSAG02_NODE_13524_length_1383_cov_1.232866_1_plen_37_part_10